MKKVILYSLLLSTATLWSCKGDYDDWADPQGYDAENPVGMSLTATSVGDVKFAELAEGTEQIDLFNTVVNVPDGAVLGDYQLSITANEATTEVEVDNDGNVSVDELNTLVVTNYGRRPEARQLTLNVSVPVAYQGKQFILRAEPFTINATLVTPNIESAYYFIGALNDWNIATSLKFDHSDTNIYDDPVFTLKFDVSDMAELWWKVIPQSSFEAESWDGLFGPAVDGDDSWSGTLVENGKAGCFKNLAGQYTLSINMLDGTYELTKSTENLYVPGNGNGWGFDSNMLYTSDFETYEGYVSLSGDFKITDRAAWGGIEYGSTGTEGSIVNGGGNISGPADGLYFMTVNTTALTYSYTAITAITLVGDAVGGWSADVPLTKTSNLVWEGDVTFSGSDSWKFRMNYGWDLNLGGTADKLVQNGDNIASPTAGTHHVTLNLSTVPYTCTVQ